jgi:hypothetical protein
MSSLVERLGSTRPPVMKLQQTGGKLSNVSNDDCPNGTYEPT